MGGDHAPVDQHNDWRDVGRQASAPEADGGCVRRMAWMSGAHKFDARRTPRTPTPTPTQASTPTMRLPPLLLPLVKLALDTTHGSTGERVHVARQLRKHAAPTAMGKRRLHVTKGLPQPLHGACQPCSLAWLGGFGAIPRLVVVGAAVAVWLGSCIWADVRRQVRPHNGEGVATEAAAWSPPHYATSAPVKRTSITRRQHTIARRRRAKERRRHDDVR